MKRKVIHILCHTAPLTREHIYYSWPARIARYMHTYSKEYEHECFITVTSIKDEKIWKEDGITYHLFPAWTLNKALESFFGIVFSQTLLQTLKQEAIAKDTIIHIQGERGLLIWQIIRILKNNPIFIQFHGYRTPDFLLFFEKLFITPFERNYFKCIKHFFVPIRSRIDYLIKNCRINPKKITHLNLGVDYDIFKPHDKIKMRKKLKLPIGKTIFLHVGRFDRVKGVKEIIDAHIGIENEYNTYLILIGGSKDNEYYSYAKENADRVITRIDNEQLIPYFNASDVYCMLCPPEKARSSGMGVAPCEALACDKPIISSNLFEAPPEIKAHIGFQVTNGKELKEKMIYLAKRKNVFNNMRTLSEPFYSWKMIIQKIFKLYKEA